MAAENASFVSKGLSCKSLSSKWEISNTNVEVQNLEVQKLKCKCEQENLKLAKRKKAETLGRMLNTPRKLPCSSEV